MYDLQKYDLAKNYYDKALKIDANLTEILDDIELKAFNSVMR